MSETLSKPTIYTSRAIARFDAARDAFRGQVRGPEWLRDDRPEIQAVEIIEGGETFRYTRLDAVDGGLVETLIDGREAR